MNKASVRDANNPMPTRQGEAGAKLLSSFEDGRYTNQRITRAILDNYASTLGQCPWMTCRLALGGVSTKLYSHVFALESIQKDSIRLSKGQAKKGEFTTKKWCARLTKI